MSDGSEMKMPIASVPLPDGAEAYVPNYDFKTEDEVSEVSNGNGVTWQDPDVFDAWLLGVDDDNMFFDDKEYYRINKPMMDVAKKFIQEGSRIIAEAEGREPERVIADGA